MEQHDKTSKDQLHWYKDAIIYELHIKAFADSNGDGIGDFKGLLQKLDYLQELGVTAIWLLPFYPSPLRDDGYDIADYYSINPSYGTMEQFQAFLEEAHKRNLKVITELVINHTSDQHPWFQRARKAAPGSPEREFYVWTEDPSKYKDVRIIFQDFESSNWTWDPEAGQYYWHRFFHHQPDLNFDNPLVQQEIFNILDFWCSMGVDGFRLDAVPYLFEREGTNGENLAETHDFLKKLRKHIDQKFPGTVFLAEANMWPEDAASYFGQGDECHMNYHFPVMPRMFMALQREDRYPITDIFDQTPAIPNNCQWAMFLRNHDELTLEMVTDEERDYMYKAYAKDPKARINLGIRHRLAPLMDNDRRRIELMNSLLFSMPGTPVLYYGDEIGMGDNFYLGDRNGVRTPMQWSPDRNAGFSSANPHSLYLPVIIDPEYNYEAVNVELQQRNTASLLWFMKRLINMRKRYKAFGRGDMKFISVDNPKVLAFTRSYEDETILVIVNLSKYAQAAEVFLPDFKGYVPVELFSKNRFPGVKEDQPYFFTLGAHTFQWFELQKEVQQSRPSQKKPYLQIDKISELLTGNLRVELETNILPGYLPGTNWFVGADRNLHSVSIREQVTIPLDISNAWLLLLEVQYESGLPEMYALPLTFVKEPLASTMMESCAGAIIAHLTVGTEYGLLCDAYYTPELQHWLFRKMAANAVVTLDTSVIHFSGHTALAGHLEKGGIKPRVHAGQQQNTSIDFDHRFFLKLYRKVDMEQSPDLELSRLLSEDLRFPNTPTYLGTVQWMLDKETVTLGMMQELVENHGDGVTYMLERVNNFIERILAKSYTDAQIEFGTIEEPVSYDELPTDLQTLLGGPAAEFARALGQRVARLHLALSGKDKEYGPEPFSLHYQRSLFSSMQSQVRSAYERLEKYSSTIPEGVQHQINFFRNNRPRLIEELKKLYESKYEAEKIRIHGNLHLQQVLYTGKDVAIHDFGGEPGGNYSERKLKRSPLKDVASMMRSFYQVAFRGFGETRQVERSGVRNLYPFAIMWGHYMGSFFLHAYLEELGRTSLVPVSAEHRGILIRSFLLEGALSDLRYALKYRPELVESRLLLINSFFETEGKSAKKILPAMQGG